MAYPAPLKAVREDVYLELQSNRNENLSPYQLQVIERDQSRVLPPVAGTLSAIGGLSLLQSDLLGLRLFRGSMRFLGILPMIPLFLTPYASLRMVDDYKLISDLLREDGEGDSNRLTKRWRAICASQEGGKELLEGLEEVVD